MFFPLFFNFPRKKEFSLRISGLCDHLISMRWKVPVRKGKNILEVDVPRYFSTILLD